MPNSLISVILAHANLWAYVTHICLRLSCQGKYWYDMPCPLYLNPSWVIQSFFCNLIMSDQRDHHHHFSHLRNSVCYPPPKAVCGKACQYVHPGLAHSAARTHCSFKTKQIILVILRARKQPELMVENQEGIKYLVFRHKKQRWKRCSLAVKPMSSEVINLDLHMTFSLCSFFEGLHSPFLFFLDLRLWFDFFRERIFLHDYQLKWLQTIFFSKISNTCQTVILPWWRQPKHPHSSEDNISESSVTVGCIEINRKSLRYYQRGKTNLQTPYHVNCEC